MIEKVEGIIISEVNYSETSKILNLLTKEYGIIGVISKGCRTLKSELRVVSEKLVYGHFNIYYKPNKLSTLVSVDVIEPFKNMKNDITKISHALFLLELTEQVYKQNNNVEIYYILINSLKKIDEGLDELVITNIVELKFLNYLGVGPVMDKCVGCGSLVSIVSLSVLKGGYICNKCRTTEAIVLNKTIQTIRMFYYVDIAKISQININETTKKEINKFLNEYYDEYTGLYLKSKSFLDNLTKIS